MRRLPSSEQPTLPVVVREVTMFPRKAHLHMRRFVPISFLAAMLVLVLLCAGVGVAGYFTARVIYFSLEGAQVYEVVQRQEPVTVASTTGAAASKVPLSPVFTPEVQFWQPLIAEWAIAWEIDPNLIATVIQIESCGNPYISSGAGAQGLFQVMPFHFDDGEDMLDVGNNARRGLSYLNGGLDWSDGHAGLALAGYNGGHSVIPKGYGAWYAETRRYYYWGAGIYDDASQGLAFSTRLQEWLAAGGQSLCDLASAAIVTYQEENAE